MYYAIFSREEQPKLTKIEKQVDLRSKLPPKTVEAKKPRQKIIFNDDDDKKKRGNNIMFIYIHSYFSEIKQKKIILFWDQTDPLTAAQIQCSVHKTSSKTSQILNSTDYLKLCTLYKNVENHWQQTKRSLYEIVCAPRPQYICTIVYLY